MQAGLILPPAPRRSIPTELFVSWGGPCAMFVRTESRIVAAAAFLLLLAAGAGTLNWLVAAAPAPPRIGPVADDQPIRPSPHLFLGEIKLAGNAKQRLDGKETALQPGDAQSVANPTPAAIVESAATDRPTLKTKVSATPFPPETKPHFFTGPAQFATVQPRKPGPNDSQQQPV